MWSARAVERVFSPLDEQLALLPTAYSPFLVPGFPLPRSRRSWPSSLG
jgi:hypothetical protein